MSERTDNGMKARVILQQCLHARLQVKPPDAESEAEWVEVLGNISIINLNYNSSFCSTNGLSNVILVFQINRGMVIYICLFKGATEEIIPQMGMQLLLSHICNKTYMH